MLRHLLVTAIRNLKRHRTFSAISVAGLAVGLGAALFAVFAIRYELGYDRFHEKRDRIFRVSYPGFALTPYPLGPRLKSELPEIEEAVAVKKIGREGDGFLITAGEKRFGEKSVLLADPGFFDVFSFPLIRGRADKALRHPGNAVLSEGAALRYFGTVDCVGRAIIVGGKSAVDLMVEAVAGDPPAGSHLRFDILLPAAVGPALVDWDDRTSWTSLNYATYVLIRNRASARAVLPKLVLGFPADRRRLRPGSPSLADPALLTLQGLTEIHLRPRARGEFEPGGSAASVALYAAVALLIVLYSIVNFANLATAAWLSRYREVGVRKILGSGRSGIVLQLLGESMTLAAGAAAAAVVLLRLAFPLLVELAGTRLRWSDIRWPEALAALAGLAAFIGLAAGAYPALFASKWEPARSLRGEGRPASGRLRRQDFLLALQFLVSVGFAAAAFVIGAQMHYLRTRDLGLDQDRIVTIRLPEALRARADGLKSELLRGPGVQSAAASNFLPSRETAYQSFDWEDRRPDDDGMLRWIAVDADFTQTYGLTVAAGCAFAPEDETAGERRFLINETAVRRFGWAQPLGKWMEFSSPFGKSGRVIGVVKDFHFRSLHHPVEALAIMAAPSRLSYTAGGRALEFQPYRYLSVKLDAGRASEALRFIERFCRTHVSDDSAAWSFFDEEFGRMYGRDMKTARMLALLSALAVLLAALGVFGLTAFMVERRRKEVSIRKVLGAKPFQILLLFSGRFLGLMLVSAVLAAPALYIALSRWLRQFAYRIALGPWFIASAAGVMALVLLGAVGWHVLRATAADPIDHLRSE